MCVCRRGEHRCLFLTGCPAPGFVTGILFMENGSVLEEGSHEQLLASGGAYARLFGIQSRYYQKECMGQEVQRDALAAE